MTPAAEARLIPHLIVLSPNLRRSGDERLIDGGTLHQRDGSPEQPFLFKGPGCFLWQRCT